jgi:hypothetical protein
MKKLIFILCFLTCLACKTEKKDCLYPTSFQLYRVYPNDRFEIRVNERDSIVFQKVFKEFFLIDSYQPRKYLIKEYCSTRDTIAIHFIVNGKNDTVFFVQPKLVKSIYFGCDQADSINIYFDYRNGETDMEFI